MKEEIKLWIGELNYPDSKLPWLPTIDSVLSTQVYIKNRYDYMTIVIFRKTTDDDFTYHIENDVIYTSSFTDKQTVHSSTDSDILIRGIYDYFDGTYYYCYLVMYSDTFDVWNVINDNTVYAALYDQTNVVINGNLGGYVMNEFRITGNVISLTIANGDASNITDLIIPNYMSSSINFGTYYPFNIAETYSIYAPESPVSGQTINTFNGLIYKYDFTSLLAVPNNYQTDSYNNIELHQNCQVINSYSFVDPDDNFYSNTINQISGIGVVNLYDSCFKYLDLKSIRFDNLEKINSKVFSSSSIERIWLPNTVTSVETDWIDNTGNLKYIFLEQGFNCDLTIPVDTIDPISFSYQMYNLLPQVKPADKTIYINSEVYGAMNPDAIMYAESINWAIISI